MADLTAHHSYAHDPDTRPAGRYHTNQIAAHWTIVFLVAFQYFSGPAMELAVSAGHATGTLPTAGVLVVHGVIGTAILGLMAWRVFLRRRHGAPKPPETEPRPLQLVSRGVHFAFYAILVAMPLAGMAAVALVGSELGRWLGYTHGVTSWVLLGLIALHVAGAAWHAAKRDGTVTRILTGQAQRAR